MDYREKMRKYVKPGTALKLKAPNGTEDVFEIKSLPMKEYPDFFDLLMRLDKFQKETKGKNTEITAFMTKENVGTIVELERRTIIHSFNLDPVKDEELIDSFIANNFFPLFNAVIEANMVESEGSPQAKALNRIKELQEAKGDPVVIGRDVGSSKQEETRAVKSYQAASP